MSEQTAPVAKVVNKNKVSTIWIIPALAGFIALWMVYYQWQQQGPEIQVQFETAEGMQIGKTKVKSRSVDVGEVTDIRLNEGTGVTVSIRMTNQSESLLKKDSQFWIVAPTINHAGVSGLSTLISGVYIEMVPGQSEDSSREFIGLDDPPVTPPGTPGLHITLNSNDQFAYSKGDPIIYKGLTVGQFEDIYFNFDERVVYYNAFIKAPYHQLVTTNTKFWDVSGLNIDLTADGLSIKTGNIETMLTNGVAFGVPKDMPLGERVLERDYFDIFASYEAANDKRYEQSTYFVLLVSDTIRGLKVGAPVEYRGVHIGRVESTNLLANQAPEELIKEDFKIPVLISMQPGRVGLPDNDEGVKLMSEQNLLWIKDGLKASLRTGNLLTGSLFVQLQHYDEQLQGEQVEYQGYPVIPVLGNQFSQLTAKAENFMDTLNALPLEQMANNSNSMLTEFQKTATELQQLSQSLEKVIVSVEEQKLASQLTQTLKEISKLSRDFSAGSKSYEELRGALSSMTQVMQELKPVIEKVNRKPNSLIFDSGNNQDMAPKRYQEEKNND